MTPDQLLALFPVKDRIPSRWELPSIQTGNHYLIDGKIKTWDGPCRQIVSPIRLRQKDQLAPIPLANGAMLTAREALHALDAAVRAYDHGTGPWPSMPVGERIACVIKFLSRMETQKEATVLLEMWEIAKTPKGCEDEFDRTLRYLDESIAALEKSTSDLLMDACSDGFATVRRAPLGVTLCMGPFNVPVFETLCTAIPAALMGNTVVIKLPRLGVLPILNLLPVFAECFPPGVINVIDGDGQRVVTPIMESGALAVLAFIGSHRVANIVRRAHPRPNHLRKVLGLDAKNPAILLPDADLDLAVEQCLRGALAFNGQRCTGLKHLWVHRDLQTTFLNKFCSAVDALEIGMPWQEPYITPLAEPEKPAWLAKLVDDATARSCRVVNSGGAHFASLFAPAVLSPVDETMEVAHVEQFGPVIPVSTFESIDQVLESVRQSNFGQQISLFGDDPKELGRLIDRFATQASRINLNSYCRRGPDHLPFTGRKDSAESVLSVTESLNTFSSELVIAAQNGRQELLEHIARDGHSRYLDGCKSKK